MAISDRQQLKQRALDALESAAYDPQKMVLIHTGAASIITLLTAGATSGDLRCSLKLKVQSLTA